MTLEVPELPDIYLRKEEHERIITKIFSDLRKMGYYTTDIRKLEKIYVKRRYNE